VGAGIRLPLRVLLPLVAVGLAAAGASAVGMAGMSAARGYLTRQVDGNLAVCAAGPLSHPVAAVPGSGLVLPGPCDAELLSAGGQLLTAAVPGAPASPVLLVGGAARLGRPVTVPGTGSGGGWRVVVAAVHYQPQRIMYVYGPDDLRYVIGGRTGSGPVGLLVVMTWLAGDGQLTGRVAASYAAAAAAVLAALAWAAFALVRAVLRPPRPAAELADAGEQAAGEQAAGGDPPPIRAAEAAARRATAEMAARLGEVALDLRTSVSVVRGFAEYCRLRNPRPSADLDRMAGRAAEEVARMEALIDRLGPADAPSPPRSLR
jgi:two-component system, OmpR family, sensor kinase